MKEPLESNRAQRELKYLKRVHYPGIEGSKDDMKDKHKCGYLLLMILTSSLGFGDTLALKNGSLIKGKFLGSTETEISLRVGSTVQKFNVADVVSLDFDSATPTADVVPPPQSSLPEAPEAKVQVGVSPASARLDCASFKPSTHCLQAP